MKKLLPILLLLLGESMAVYSEIIAAKEVANFSATFWKTFVIITVAGVPLLLGYMLGVKYFPNIWVVGAVSIATIVIVEPIITFLVFHTLPSRGALIGLILAVFAILSALFIK